MFAKRHKVQFNKIVGERQRTFLRTVIDQMQKT